MQKFIYHIIYISYIHADPFIVAKLALNHWVIEACWHIYIYICIYIYMRQWIRSSLIQVMAWCRENLIWTNGFGQLGTTNLAVREITKSSSTFSATNISSNIIWFLQLHDIIKMKSNHTWINYTHNNIAIRSHMMIYNSVWNLIFATKFSSIYLTKWEKVWFFDYHLLTCSVRKMVLICLMQNIDICLLYKSHQIACLVSHLINHFSKWMFTV